MEKIVSSGEQDCTVELDGTECAVVFSSNYKCFTVQNETADDIYISVSPNISAGKDGVRRIGAGASGAIAHGAKNTLYILGSGSVQVTASDSPGNFFKPAPAAGGGGTVDGYSKSESDARYAQKTDVPDSYTKTESDTKYAQKTEIPVSLPANGGNADTVDNIHINTEDVKSSVVDKVNPIYDDEILKYNSETSSIERWKTDSFKVAYASYANTSNSAQKVVSGSGKAQLWEDDEGGNLRLTSPDGNHLMEMDFYNNQDFRIYFSNNGELTFPVSYNAGTKKFNINGNAGGVSCSLIGTASGCHYSTILDWANAQDGNANASIIAASGFPSDSPYQNEAMLSVQADVYNARKIVTWTQYLAGQTPKIMQRCIFNGAWSDNNWRAVYG